MDFHEVASLAPLGEGTVVRGDNFDKSSFHATDQDMFALRAAQKRMARNLRGLDALERILLLVIFAGAALRVATFWTQVPRYDGTAYMAEGTSLANGLGFTGPWGRYDNPFSSTPEATNLGPVYPLYLSIFYLIAGFSIEVTQIAGILLGLCVLLLAYLAGWNLYGRFVGLLTCAILSANPLLITYPGWGQADNLPVLCAIVIVWGLVRGVRNQKWLDFAVAGLGTALFALAKAQGVGLGITLGMAAGFVLWRILESGRREITRPGTWSFVAVFLAPLMSWFAWGPHVGPAPALISPSYIDVLLTGGVKFLFVVYVLAFTLAFLLPELVDARSLWHTEEGRFLWLAGLGLSGIVWALLVANYAAGLVPGSTWSPEQGRHLVPAIVPFVWLAAPHLNAQRQSLSDRWLAIRRPRWLVSIGLVLAIPVAVWFGTYLDGVFLLFLALAAHVRPTRQRIIVLLALSLLVASNAAFDVRRSPEDSAGIWLQMHVHAGDVVALDPWAVSANTTGSTQGPIYKYELYPYLGDKNVRIVPYGQGVNATFILSWKSGNYTGYRLVGGYDWESKPGPLGLAWAWLVDAGRVATGRYVTPTPVSPSAWLLERST